MVSDATSPPLCLGLTPVFLCTLKADGAPAAAVVAVRSESSDDGAEEERTREAEAQEERAREAEAQAAQQEADERAAREEAEARAADEAAKREAAEAAAAAQAAADANEAAARAEAEAAAREATSDYAAATATSDSDYVAPSMIRPKARYVAHCRAPRLICAVSAAYDHQRTHART
jgi:fused signal recognition particle receptor